MQIHNECYTIRYSYILSNVDDVYLRINSKCCSATQFLVQFHFLLLSFVCVFVCCIYIFSISYSVLQCYKNQMNCATHNITASNTINCNSNNNKNNINNGSNNISSNGCEKFNRTFQNT